MIFITAITLLDFYGGVGDPNGVLTARKGSYFMRTDTPGLAINQNGGTSWRFLAPASGTWVLPPNDPSALVIGSAVDPNMMVFDTTTAAEVINIGATLGLRVLDGSALRFGTTDRVLITPNGADAVVTGPGSVVWSDNFFESYGTSATARFTWGYSTGLSSITLSGNGVSAGGASPATPGGLFKTGARVKTDNNAGTPGSGGWTFATGDTDVTFVGATTGGPTGPILFQTGNALSTGAGAVSGPSSPISFITGNSVDGASGGLLFQTGTAGTTRGGVTFNVPSFDGSLQAQTWTVINGNGNALVFGCTGTPVGFQIDTTGGKFLARFAEAGLDNLPIAAPVASVGAPSVAQLIPVDYAAGPGNTDTVLPARASGWLVVDAWCVNTSGGVGAGNAQVQTGAGVAISGALAQGAADAVTRTAALVNAAAHIAGGGVLRVNRDAACTAGRAYVALLPM